MYEELLIEFKDGSIDSFSPLEEMKMDYEDDKITMYYYGTLQIWSQVVTLKDVNRLLINEVNEEDMEVLKETVIYSENINNIEEFDNLSNSTYGILNKVGK